MQRLVLITYLALVLAVAGQAVHTHKQAADKPDKQQVRVAAVETTNLKHDMAKENRSGLTRDRVRGAEDLATRGSENPQEMRAHRDDRKEMQFWGD